MTPHRPSAEAYPHRRTFRTGSGYFNHNGELSYRIKTTAKAVTVEADVWQGLKAEVVRLNLTVGLGL